jgi:DNA modification methylase
MNKIFFGDCIQSLQALPEKIVHTCVTSPPYFGLRDYQVDGQIGLEQTPDEYVAKLVGVFREVRRVLRDDGTLWLNLGDSYAGGASNNRGGMSAIKNEKSRKDADGAALFGAFKKRPVAGLKPKDLIGIPWRVAFALQADGWFLRQDIIWAKPNPMPESVTDRCTKSHEYIFLLSKSERYYFDHEAIKEPTVTRDTSIRNRDETRLNNTPGRTKMGGLVSNNYETRNRRSVWNVSTKPYKGAHFATFPPDLITPCVLAGSPPEGTVLDPFMGSGTTAMVALTHGRRYIGCELNPAYGPLQEERIYKLFADMI